MAFDVTVAKLVHGGPHVYVTALHRALAQLLGDRLQPIASRLVPPSPGRRTVVDRLRTPIRDLWWHQGGVMLAARRAGAALIHLPAGLGPVRPALPVVLTIHDLNVLRFPRLFRAWFRHYTRLVLPRAARASDGIIAVSHATKMDVVEQLSVPEERVTVVPNGVDPVFAPPPAHSQLGAEVRRYYGLPQRFVLTVGFLEPRKNLPRLLEAVHRLRQRSETADVALVHAGPEGWMADGVERAVRVLSLSDAVHFLGRVPRDHLAALYGMAQICAYPSLYEGFGLPVVEAMACGCPVLTSNVSSLPEVAGDAAVLVDPTSVEEITEGIRRLWTDAALRRNLGVKGLSRARAFTWERTASETLAVYDRILG